MDRVERRAWLVLVLVCLALPGCKKSQPTPAPAPAVTELVLAELSEERLRANAKAAGYKELVNEPDQIEGGTIYNMKLDVEGKDVHLNFYDFSGWEQSAAKPSITLEQSRLLYVSAMGDSGSPTAELAREVKAGGALGELNRARLEAAIARAGWKVDSVAEEAEEGLGVKTLEIEAIKSEGEDEADATINLYDFGAAAGEGRAVASHHRALVVACPEDGEVARQVLRRLVGG
ncbi:MAG: hypothetical protein KIT72_03465 [Polyangiaceae bacterium]|nr:hypothetical protein [Polyangiaceae bacterium]